VNIAQLWHRIALSLGGLTLAGIGAFVTWLFSIRKLNAEVREIKQRMDNTDHRQLIERLALLLVRRAECLDPNTKYASKAQWAAMLGDDANLVDEVLMALRRDDLVDDGHGVLAVGPKLLARHRNRG
jgi:hypothetical protein